MKKMAFEAQEFVLSWHDITLTVIEKSTTFWNTKTKIKHILDNVSGFATSNSLFVIMGISGSGKTSLLRAISGQCRQKSGFLQINNTKITDSEMSNVSGYLPQQDIFTEYLTVLEYFEFMAALQMKNKTQKRKTIKQLLSELCLERQEDTLIKNLSGGEKRRLSLAGELISDPLVLFCDEPTTGLDSYGSLIVTEKLQKRALSGKIVIATIHQPSSQLLQYFDNITLLAEGKLVFQGTREEADFFFASMNLSCPDNYNPLDFYIKCLTTEDISKLCEKFEEKRVKTYSSGRTISVVLENKKKSSFFHEVNWLLWRNSLIHKRNKGAYFGSYFTVLVELVIVALFYSQVSLSNSHSPQDIQGFFGLLASEFTYTNMYAVVNVFPGEIAVFIREKTLYSSHAYFISKVLSAIPLVAVTTIMYMSVLFASLQFLNADLWLQITIWMFLVSMGACGLGLAFSATFSTVQHIDLYLGPVEFLFMLLSGLMVRLDKIPVFFAWMKYLSPFYYGFDASSNIYWAKIPYTGNCTIQTTYPCYNNGTEILKNYGVYKTYPTILNMIGLNVLTLGFMLLGFLGLARKKYLNSI